MNKKKASDTSTKNSTDQNTTSSSQTQISTIELESSQKSESQDTGFTEAEAIQKIQDSFSSKGWATDNMSLVPVGKVDEDYVFKLVDLSVVKQGGSGSAGFYRVSPQGAVTETDSEGNPY